MDKTIRVWRWKDAPSELRVLSTHGGDEDWVALVPNIVEEEGLIPWLESGSPFGCYDVSRQFLNGFGFSGWLYIGAHA